MRCPSAEATRSRFNHAARQLVGRLVCEDCRPPCAPDILTGGGTRVLDGGDFRIDTERPGCAGCVVVDVLTPLSHGAQP